MIRSYWDQGSTMPGHLTWVLTWGAMTNKLSLSQPLYAMGSTLVEVVAAKNQKK